MHGMVDIITAKMGKEQTSLKSKLICIYEKLSFTKVFNIAMIVILAIIAIILVDLISESRSRIEELKIIEDQEFKNINVKLNDDESIDKFIKGYFTARTNLNYPKIFSAYGRDYYKEERESENENSEFKKTINNLRYEKTFVKSYDNVVIYTEKGFYENEVICVVTYDMAFGFTSDVAPMIIIFYLEKSGDTFVIKENLDVGTSKYVVSVANTEFVKALYDDIYIRLNRLLTSNESLKLAYNSFRQSEMNMKSSFGPLRKKDRIDKIETNKLDPIKNAKEIYDKIVTQKKENENKEKLNNYLDKVIASLSVAQRIG